MHTALRNSLASSLNQTPGHRPLKSERDSIFSIPVAKLEIGPGQELRLSLGAFTTDHPPLGFSIEFATEPEPADSVVVEINPAGSAKRYELLLRVINNGGEWVSAEVRQMKLRLGNS